MNTALTPIQFFTITIKFCSLSVSLPSAQASSSEVSSVTSIGTNQSELYVSILGIVLLKIVVIKIYQKRLKFPKIDTTNRTFIIK